MCEGERGFVDTIEKDFSQPWRNYNKLCAAQEWLQTMTERGGGKVLSGSLHFY